MSTPRQDCIEAVKHRLQDAEARLERWGTDSPVSAAFSENCLKKRVDKWERALTYLENLKDVAE